MAPEAFSWREANVYFYSAGEAGVAQAFVENVAFQYFPVYRTYRNLTTGAWDARYAKVLADQKVVVRMGRLWTSALELLRARSGTAWNFAVSATNPLQTGAFQIWSAAITDLQIRGQQHESWVLDMSFEGHGYSAL